MKIARVFPRKTNLTPIDPDAYIGEPGFFTPKDYDEARVSVTFTWDIPKAYGLALAWKNHAKKVIVGGPALGSPCDDFTPGLYIKQGVTFTSRGCPNACGFCLVPRREGKLRELPIVPGNIIQDNNFLACSDEHKAKVYEMLKGQKAVCFKGGLEPSRITLPEARKMKTLRIRELWLACDSDDAITGLRQSVRILKRAGFKRYQLRCYVLIGFDMKKEEKRLRAVYRMGCLPFSQLYQPADRKQYAKDWEDFNRKWSRPAAYRSAEKKRRGI
jgi:hypothetical protein